MKHKYCPRCESDKLVEFFGVNSSRPDGMQGYCKDCRNSQVREWYKNSDHKVIHAERMKSSNKKYKELIRSKILEYLRVHPCVDCGTDDTEVLEFDHIDPKLKTDSISNMMRYHASWGKIEQEIQKCEVRCANDHRKRTIRQFGWYRLVEVLDSE